MKIFQTGLFCLCFLIICGSPQAFAQEQPAAQSADDPKQNPITSNPASQNPTSQNPAAQPPASQNPASQNPGAQAAPAQPSTAVQPQTGPTVNAPPDLPKYPDVRLPGEYGWFIGVDFGNPTENPSFNKGRNSGIVNNSLTKLYGTPKYSDSAEIGIALGLHNMLRLSYFQVAASGNFTTPTDFTAWSQTYTPGTLVSTDYKLQNFKISFDYLTWPYPVESRKFRLKTLWQIQYTSVKTTFNAPQLPLVDSSGNIIVDANGNPISYVGSGSRWFILPTFGLSATEYLTHNLRLEASADGFAIPHHSSIWDAEASLNYRVSHFELRGGAKAFHFKTSTSGDFYTYGTFASAFVGVRWYSR